MGEERSWTEKINDESRVLIDEIKEKARGNLIVVEGKKDRVALKTLGIKGKFFLLSGQRNSLYESAEKIALEYSSVLLFLDLDTEGLKLRKVMKNYLGQLGVEADANLAKNLLRLAKTQFVEGLKIDF